MVFRLLTLVTPILFVACLSLQAQTLTFVDIRTQSPLSFTLVYSKDLSFKTTADQKGVLKLPEPLAYDSLYARQIGYLPIAFAIPTTDQKIQMEPNSFSLDEVVVSANRWEQKRAEISSFVQKVDQKEILLQQPQTSADLIGGDGLVYIQKSQMGGGSPMIRGFSTNRVLLVVDGIRMNNAIFRSGNLQNIISLDPQFVQEAEVLYGPSSVIYGSDAIGGVMDFHTLEGPARFGSKWEINGKAAVRYSSANQEQTGHLSVNYGNRSWEGVTALSYSDFGDLRMGRWGPDTYLRPEFQARVNGQDSMIQNEDPEVQKSTAYQQWSALQKLSYRWENGVFIEGSSMFSQTGDIPRYDRLIQYRADNPRSAEWYYGPQIWNLNRVELSVPVATSWYDHFSMRLAHQYFEESRYDRSWQSEDLRARIERVWAPSVNWDLDKRIGRWKLFYGLDAVYNLIGSEAREENIRTGMQRAINTRYPNRAQWASTAAYLSSRWEAGPESYLNMGLRANYNYIFAPLNNLDLQLPFEEARLDFFSFSGSIGWVQKVRKELRWFANFSTGFRAPNIDDIAKVFDSEPGAVVVPNPNLEAEYAYSLDWGLTYSAGSWWKSEVSLFATWLDNAMVRRDFSLNGQDSIIYDGTLSKVQAIQNVAAGYVVGGQVQLSAQVSQHIRLSGRLSYQYGRSDEEGSLQPLRHAAPLFGSISSVYERSGWTARVQCLFNGERPFEDMAPSEVGKPHIYASDALGRPYSPAWYRVDLSIRKQWGPLQLGVSLENISDQRYRPYSSGIVAAGRNLMLNAAYVW